MKDNSGIFKKYDIRFKHDSLDDKEINLLCEAVVSYMRDTLCVPSVVICRDARLYAPLLAQDLTDMFVSNGVDVLLNPLPVSTCQFYYTCLIHPESAGLMITASHNPGEYIGIKITGPSLSPVASGYGVEGGIDKIRSLYEADAHLTPSDRKGRCTVVNELDSYIDFAMRISNVKEGSLEGMNILMESLSGSAGNEFALAFQKAGATLTFRNIIPDGHFRHGDPNPGVESSIRCARQEMRDSHFDMGFCFDGDGDRLDLMYPDGSQIIPGLNFSIIAKELQDLYRGEKCDVFVDTKCPPPAQILLRQKGLGVHLITNGHSVIKHNLKKNFPSGYFAAVEETSHYFLNLPFDENDFSKGFAATESTLIYALLSARCLRERPSEYESIRKIQDSIFRKREWSLHCNAGSDVMALIMDSVQSVLTEKGGKVISKMDDGSDLGATVIRFNLPDVITQDTELCDNWVQIAQRISASEDGIIRFDISSARADECVKYNDLIVGILKPFIEKGLCFI